jgi:putative membrane protein
MRTAAGVVIAFIALEHLWFFVLESFLWRTPLGMKTFRMDAAKAAITAPLAQNQGVYNAFLAAGLVWSLLNSEPPARPIAIFFLGCVALAGIAGALTVSRRILLIQTVPAALGLVFLAL